MARRKKGRPVHGWLVVNKPQGPSSTQIVGKIRRLANAQKTGHGGTLDPMATGVLTLAFGEATKTSGWQLDSDKGYEFVITWGQSTDTLDAEGTVIDESDARPESKTQIEAVLDQFRGDIEQMPPAYSALKVDGKRAYDLARAGEKVVLKPRQLHIHQLEILDHDPEATRFRVGCSKGTYVRSLARDIAAAIKVPGHVTVLHRIQSGPFLIEQALDMESLEARIEAEGIDALLLPVDAAIADMPGIILDDRQAKRLMQGQTVDRAVLDIALDIMGPCRALYNGELLAIADLDETELRSRRVMQYQRNTAE